MRLWRITASEHAPGLDGEGARLWGGRWNSPGTAMVYTASSLALALLEIWVHLPPAMRRPDTLPERVSVEIDYPDALAIEILGEPDWSEPEALRRFGDEWAGSGRTLALSVPSAVIPAERNLLLNPAHPDMASIRVLSVAPFHFDPRMAS